MQNDLEIREGLIQNDIAKADKSVWVCHKKKLKTSQSQAAPFYFFKLTDHLIYVHFVIILPSLVLLYVSPNPRL